LLVDARELLNRVAETYAKMQSFEVEILYTSESGDEDASERHSKRNRAWFQAPRKVRWQRGGANAVVMVTDGVVRHHYSEPMKHYWSFDEQPGAPLMGSFQYGYPLPGGMVFLFPGIAERVTEAAMVKEDAEEAVISVSYEIEPNPFFSVSGLLFTIDRQRNLVLQMEAEVTHRFPGREGSRTSRDVYAYSHAFLNQPIPEAAFQYVPPADAVNQAELHHGRSGGGSSQPGPDGYETWHSTEWKDNTFVDNFELKIRGMELNFERRLSFSEGKVQMVEKVSGPQGESEHASSMEV
jgi:outer membrane lipoprotein-sorting protein